MEEVTINITEEVEEITINVFEGGTEQIQSDFEQTDETAVDFIKNKPKIDDTVTEGSENAVKSSGIWAFVTTQIDAVKNWATNLFLKKSDEDKGSVAVEGHEQEYNHNAFLTSVPPIPSDISDLADTQGLIPPHLFFDDTYFSGAGTEVDPKSLRTENLPSGGGGVAPKRVATWVATDDTVNTVDFTHWDNGDPFDISKGFEVRAAIDIENIAGNKGLVLRLNNKARSGDSKIQNSLDLEGTLYNYIRTIKLVDGSKLITQVVYMRVLKKGTEIMGESINTGEVNRGNIFYSDGYNLNTNITTINCVNIGSAPKWLTGSTIIIYEL